MRLVPTSRPIVSGLAISFLLIVVLLCCAPRAERGLRRCVSLPQTATVFGRGEAALRGVAFDPLFSRRETPPHLGAAGIEVTVVVLESETGDAGVLDQVVVRQAQLGEGKPAGPVR